MATVTKENIGLLHEKLSVTIDTADYLPAFEKALKEYGKNANIPGFRKGMVPAGLIKKMYGASVFTDEVLRTVDKELVNYLQNEKLDIFAQPLPLEADIKNIDHNQPSSYTFHFEIGMKPSIEIPALDKAPITRYVVTVTDEMVNNETERLQTRYGNMTPKETVETEDNVLTVFFKEVDATGAEVEGGVQKENSLLVKYFTPATQKELMGKKEGDVITISLATAFEANEKEFITKDLGLEADADKTFALEIKKVGLLEKRELNEEFFTQMYPAQEVKTEEDFKNKIKAEIEAYWNSQARNQIHDQLFHYLTDKTQVELPEAFLKNWAKTSGEKPKTDEEVEAEFPTFLSQLKWTLISDKLISENGISVSPDEIKDFAKQQLFSYMGGTNLSDDQPWVNDYVEKMMKDRKYVEDAYNRLQTSKMFEFAETKLNPTDKDITAEEFTKMVEEHQHHHH